MSNGNDFPSTIPLNKLRKRLGLQPIVHKKTECLYCRKIFTSKNYPHVRLCKRCKERRDWKLGFDSFDQPQNAINSKSKTQVGVSWSDMSEKMLDAMPEIKDMVEAP